MAWKWFVQKDDLIDGPLSTEDVQSRLQGGHFRAHHLIWSPGQDQWQNIQAWTQALSGLGTTNLAEPERETWHYALNGQSRGPMERATLVAELKALESLAEVMVWTKGMKEWAALFEFHDLLNAIGVNKRQFPRADLAGKAVLKAEGATFIAPLLTVSEGGFGISLDSGLVAGQVVTVELQSPSFREPLHAKAEVRYISDGVVGMKFTQINVESRGSIIQFIKQNQMRFNIKAA